MKKLENIQIRLIILVLTLLVAFLLLITFQRKNDFNKRINYNIDFRQEKENIVTNIISLKAEGIKAITFENSQWDEMVQYVQTRDKKLTHGTLLLKNGEFGIDYNWVYNNKLELIYSANKRIDTILHIGLIDSINFRDYIKDHYFTHFFIIIDGELVEIFGAPIQPTQDHNRTSKPAGFLLYGKIWNEQYIESLENLTNSKINITNEISYTQNIDDLISNSVLIKKNIYDFNKKFLKSINFIFNAEVLIELNQASNKTYTNNLLFFFIILLALSIFLYLYIAKPIKTLSQSLITDDFEKLTPVLESKTEFREFAELLIKYNHQKRELQAEISKKNHIMEQLFLSEAKYRGIFENMINGLALIEVITNSNGEVIDFLIIEMNTTLANILELDREITTGEKLSEIITLSWVFKHLDILQKIAVKGENISVELLLPNNSRYYSISAFSPKKYWCALILEDVNDRKQAEISLHDTNKQLELTLSELKAAQEQLVHNERLKVLGQMASGIAHDINNALTPILGYVDILLFDNKNQNITESLKVIQTAGIDIKNTVEHLKIFYRPKSNQEITYSIQLNEIIETTLELTKHRWKSIPQSMGKEIVIIQELSSTLPNIQGKTSDIREILTNLIINASDAMNNNGILAFKTFTRDNKVILEVTDNGAGMDTNTKAHCLEPFYTTKGNKGTGMGLAMVANIVQSHNAILEIESELGKGTTFRISFNVDTENQIIEDYTNFNRILKILCISDDPVFLDMMYSILTEHNHIVTTSLSSEDGISIFEKANKNNTNFDIVMIDTGLKKINRKETAKQIQLIKSDTPIILITSWLAELDPAIGYPNVFLLNKPLTVKDLNQLLNKIFYQKKD
jgi:nitrogen-specific signal transduction histidine kinase/PAS domain-containing protein